jgi:hypothetical protein
MAYCSLADLKAYLKIDSSNTDDDTLLQAFLDAAQGAIDLDRGRTFEAAADSTRRFDAVRDVGKDDGDSYAQTLYLDQDLCQITSITNGDGTTVTSSQYVTEPRNDTPYWAIKLKLDSGIVWTYSSTPENAIAITGRWAYSVTAGPAVVQVVKEWAKYMYKKKDAASDFDVLGNVESGAVILAKQMPWHIRLLLNLIPQRLV